MARCSICQHADVAGIDMALRQGLSLRDIQACYGVNKSSVHRHAQHQKAALATVNREALPLGEEESRETGVKNGRAVRPVVDEENPAAGGPPGSKICIHERGPIMVHPNITSMIRLVHPEEAAQLVQHAHFPGQRNFRRWYVEYLAMLMRRQTFLEGTQIHLVRCQGKLYLVNGQHTLMAIIAHGKPYWLDVLETEVPDVAKARAIYTCHDRGLSRTLSDTFHANACAEALEITSTQVDALGAAIPLLVFGFQRGFKSYTTHNMQRMPVALKDQTLRWQFMQDWAAEARAFFDDMSGATAAQQKVLLRCGVMAVALVTYRHTGKDASEFWHAVAHDTARETRHPSKTLLFWLLETTTPSYGNPAVYARYVVSGWNAAYNERSLHSLHPQDIERPINIAGTPHTAKSVMFYIGEDWEVLHDPVAVSGPHDGSDRPKASQPKKAREVFTAAGA
jgi:hypothetical protein